jgi:hypothetical protein
MNLKKIRNLAFEVGQGKYTIRKKFKDNSSLMRLKK